MHGRSFVAPCYSALESSVGTVGAASYCSRCWANSQQDTEVRLGLARRSLELKITRLQADIKLLKEQSEFQQCQKNGTPTSSPPEGVSLSSMPGAPAPPEIVFADIPRD